MLCVFLTTGTAAAGGQYGTAELTWASTTAHPGDTVTLTVSTADDPNPNGGGDGGNSRYVVSFPTAVLSYMSHTDSGTCTLHTGDGNNGDISDLTCIESPGAGNPGDPVHSDVFTFSVAQDAPAGPVDVSSPVIDYGRENHYGVVPDPQLTVTSASTTTEPTSAPTTKPAPTTAPSTTSAPTTAAPTTTTKPPTPGCKHEYGTCVPANVQKVIDHIKTFKGFKKLSGKQQTAFLNAAVPGLVSVAKGKNGDKNLAFLAAILYAVLAH